MPTPVDHDPFASAAPAAVPVPVDHDPFASDPSASPQPHEHKRWNVLGDITDAWKAGTDKIATDARASVDQAAIRQSLKNKEGTPLSKIPGDIVGLAEGVGGALLHSTVGSALSYPIEAMDRLQGVKPEDYNKKIQGLTGNFQIKDPKSAGDDLADIVAGGAVLPKVGIAADLAAAKPIVEAAGAQKARDSAMKTVAQRAAQDKVTPDAWEAAKAKAKSGGDSFTLMDMGKNLSARAGRSFRSPGESSSILDEFLKKRDAEVGPQLDQLIGKIAKGPTYDAINHLYGDRSAMAGPIFKQAFEHGSTAPFQRTYEKAFAEVGAAEQEAMRRVQAAKNLEMSSHSRVVTGGTRPIEQAGELRAKTAEAEHQLEAIQAQKKRTVDLMRKAQEDGTANAPGATWSPRLEELRADPDIAAGLKRGLKIEKKNALAEGRPFHDRDYAITGYDEHGDPIVGTVPTMKAWAAAKEGMDAIVMEQVHPIGSTSAGRPTKEGFANRKLRDVLREELTTLNPKYGEAINAWAGPSESIDAINAGRLHFGRGETDAQIIDEYSKLTPANKEFYKLGAAEDLISRESRVATAGDETKAIDNSRRDKARIRMLFDDPAEADEFLGHIARKRQMFETKNKVAGNSATAERLAEDKGSRFATAGQHALTAWERTKNGHLPTAAREAWRAGQALVTNKDKEAEIAKIFADPNAKLPTPKGPRQPKTLQQLLQEAGGPP